MLTYQGGIHYILRKFLLYLDLLKANRLSKCSTRYYNKRFELLKLKKNMESMETSVEAQIVKTFSHSNFTQRHEV